MKKKSLIIIFSIIAFLIICLIMGFIYLYFIQEDKVPVLTFHNVVRGEVNPNSVDINISTFEKKIKYLADHGYKSLSMDDFYEWKSNRKKIPRKSVLITFDDGWESFYTNAVPILEKYQMKASVFVIFKYTENCTNNPNSKCPYMTFDELKDLQDNHQDMEVLSHSYNLHIKEFADSANYDLYLSDINKVKELSKSDIKYYAYPFGHTNKEYERALTDSGYNMAFTFGPYDFASRDVNNYEVPRMGIFESTSDIKFKLHMFLEI